MLVTASANIQLKHELSMPEEQAEDEVALGALLHPIQRNWATPGAAWRVVEQLAAPVSVRREIERMRS